MVDSTHQTMELIDGVDEAIAIHRHRPLILSLVGGIWNFGRLN